MWRLLYVIIIVASLLLIANMLPPKSLDPTKVTIRENKPVLTGDIYPSGFKQAHPELCPYFGAKLHLLILVASAPWNFLERDAIRKTWGHHALRSDVKIAFFTGIPSEELTDELKTAIDEEEMLYGDVITGRFIDKYWNLTLKTISMLEWVYTFCNKVPIILKTYDGIFINVPKLLDFANAQRNATKAIWGNVMRKPKHHSFLSFPQYNPEKDLKFASGAAYLLTTEVVKDILSAAKSEPYFGEEDLFITGVLRTKLGIEIKEVKQFEVTETDDPHPCILQTLMFFNKVSYNDNFNLWRKMFIRSVDCITRLNK